MSGINLLKRLKEKQDLSGEPLEEDEGAPPALSLAYDDDKKKRAIILAVAILAIFGMRFGMGQYTQNEMMKLNQKKTVVAVKLQKAEKKLAEVKVFTDQAKVYEIQMNEIQRKIDVIASISLKRNLLLRMLDYVVREMPETVWLSEVMIRPATQGSGAVEITGYADKLQMVSEFMQRLEGGVFFPNWILQESTGVDPKTLFEKNANIPLEAKKFIIKAEVMK